MSAVLGDAEVRRISRLSRLKLSEGEVRRLADQLTRILAYVRQIESLDTEGIEPVAHALPLTGVLREDEPREGISAAVALANAPDVERDCFRVPAVLDPHANA